MLLSLSLSRMPSFQFVSECATKSVIEPTPIEYELKSTNLGQLFTVMCQFNCACSDSLNVSNLAVFWPKFEGF